VAQAVDLLVDLGFLLDVGIGARDIRLRLIVVVVGDEVLDRVLREELLELGVELRREGLVVGEDEGRSLDPLDHLRHRVGLARAGDAEQRLMLQPRIEAIGQFSDRFRLVAGRLEGRVNSEIRHVFLLLSRPRLATTVGVGRGAITG
jgi:hypothetical protein